MAATKRLREYVTANLGVKSDADDQTVLSTAAIAFSKGTLSAEKFADLTRPETSGPNPRDVFSTIRVRGVDSHYSTTKSVAKHAKTGRTFTDERGRERQLLSELEVAKSAAYIKLLASKAGMVTLNEHERTLLEDCFQKDSWVAEVNGQVGDVSGMRVKTLLNDSTSGGVAAVPLFFDDALITYPLLFSELVPLVELMDVPRGTNIQTAQIQNPTAQWGAADGTTISTFNTDSMVSQVNTTIYPITIAVEIGRDFLVDSLGNVGQLVLQQIGQRLAAELDRVIAGGNGTAQPQGILNASGLTDIGNPAGGSGASPQIDDYEALMFGIAKQYRKPMYRCAFLANDTTYRRARAIPVNVSSDARRIFGLDEGAYEMFAYPFSIQNDLANTVTFFGAMSKYRLYRREASEVRWVDTGRELALRNTNLLLVRGRFGGKVMDSSAFVKQTHAKA